MMRMMKIAETDREQKGGSDGELTELLEGQTQ